MKKLTIFIIICFIFSTSIFAQTKNNEKPFVIPEIKNWEGYTGDFIITNKTKIVCHKNNSELLEAAQQFSSDYEKMFNIKLTIEEEISKDRNIILNLTNIDNIGNAYLRGVVNVSINFKSICFIYFYQGCSNETEKHDIRKDFL